MTTDAPAEIDSPARPQILRRRADFVRAAKRGVRVNARAFTLQMAARDDAAGPRFGVTVTKKVAGAVGRNRIRRRLKEALRIGGAGASLAPQLGPPPLGARPGRDYVFVARRAALTLRFPDLLSQMVEGFARLDRAAIDSRSAERAPREKPTSTFSQRALNGEPADLRRKQKDRPSAS